MRTSTGQAVRLADYRPPDYLIERVALDVCLDRHATRIVSRLTIRANPLGRADAALELDGDELVFVGAELNGAPLDAGAYVVDADKFSLANPPRETFELQLETRLDPAANTKLMGLYRSGSAYCTQCEAEGFRRITYFLDRPDVLATYRLRIEASKAEAGVLLGNGNLTAAGDCADASRHFAIWNDPWPKPCYLFALVAGNLGCLADRFVTSAGKSVQLGIYVEPGREAQARYAMDALKRAMRWDERAYGREYDLDVFNIVAVSDFNMGAMENKGLNVFNDKYVLASPETATDDDYAGIETVIAHEYFHNWTGNRITCRDWFQLCLKEGLTVFRDQEFSADERSAPVKRIADVRGLRAAQFSEDAGPLAHNVRPESYVEINNFYTATVYQKGAEIIRMLKRLIGAKAFRAGMDLYFERCDGMAATVEDFLHCFAQSSGRDLSDFIRWYGQSGTPLLTLRSAYDSGAGTLTLDIAQSTAPTREQAVKAALTMPIAIGLVSDDGAPVALVCDSASVGELERGVFELNGASRRLVFSNLARRPAVSFLRDFSAPARVDDDLSENDLKVLSRWDSDPFNRWQAIQSLATRALVRTASGADASANEGVIEAYGGVLADAYAGKIDAAFAAQTLALPSEADLAREIAQNVDPDRIFRARDDLRRALARRHGAALASLHDRLADSGEFRHDAAGAGRRSLRNGVLATLAMGDPAEGQSRAQAQYRTARSMSEKFGAMAALAQISGPARERTLAEFAQDYAHEPLILDKWFALQAHIPEAETLARVEALMRGENFSFLNPNRVRALIGGFCSNQTQFNRRDGEGYRLLERVVLQLDRVNPQVAARLVTAIRSWRAMEPGRQGEAQAMLQRLAAIRLSADVGDIVTRCLG